MKMSKSTAISGVFFVLGGIGRDRKPVKPTRQTDPHNFDDYLSFENAKQPLANDSLYVDNMEYHEPEKYAALMLKHFNTTSNFWEGRSPEKVEAFLRDYCDEPDLQLVRIWTCCNKASGADQFQFEFLSHTRPLPEGYIAPRTRKKSKAAKVNQPCV
jgi:hypothetical protein